MLVLFTLVVFLLAMHVITRRALNTFAVRYPDSKDALTEWYRMMRRNEFGSFAELRALFPAADKVGKLTVFNIGGNKYRLVAAIHYNRKLQPETDLHSGCFNA
jgi:mRNA interferase HigB